MSLWNPHLEPDKQEEEEEEEELLLLLQQMEQEKQEMHKVQEMQENQEMQEEQENQDDQEMQVEQEKQEEQEDEKLNLSTRGRQDNAACTSNCLDLSCHTSPAPPSSSSASNDGSPVEPTSSLYGEDFMLYRRQAFASTNPTNSPMNRGARRTAADEEDPENLVRSREQRRSRLDEMEVRVSYLKYKRNALLHRLREMEMELANMKSM